MRTDTSEKSLESLIVADMTAPGRGWIAGDPKDYDREYFVDLAQPSVFLCTTQPESVDALDLGHDGPTRRKFLARLQGEISKRGTIDVLRHGIRHGPHQFNLFYGIPCLLVAFGEHTPGKAGGGTAAPLAPTGGLQASLHAVRMRSCVPYVRLGFRWLVWSGCSMPDRWRATSLACVSLGREPRRVHTIPMRDDPKDRVRNFLRTPNV